ncbi:ABC transporter ATP-binding protein [Vogesella indigofera]|uniref:ABC transporter ATP-binding protein n=1 Tax=Vogesella indigofera TaxID=45465 RepID=UPI00234C93C8|nr:ABC transporter ATP-binding protein [Vogesella indigofera]MDC7702742.1 ABC transporter ATP-binding protein [Vogesella indigofera]
MGTIKVSGLGKFFKIYPQRAARLKQWLGLQKQSYQEKWILCDLDFEIRAGETIGIIGRNGAGKSTLLKMLTGTLLPSTGSIEKTGRLSALLELGMGFHPDFSGRQNAYMSGQMMGLTRDDISAIMPDILAFAEIGDAIDQPVRTYSSGMQVRLAFSLATAVRPEILIVDEALAVGDAYFQHKCFKRIRDFKQQGVTLLFVSHDPLAIKSLCERAILLEKGRMVMDDTPDKVLDYYNALIALDEAVADEHDQLIASGAHTRSGNGKARLQTIELYSAANLGTRLLRSGEAVRIAIRYQVHETLPDGLTLGFLFRDRLGNEIYGTNTFHKAFSLPASIGQHEVGIDIPALPLGAGSYNLSFALHSEFNHIDNNYDWWDQALTFEMVKPDKQVFSGVVEIPCQFLLPASKEPA